MFEQRKGQWASFSINAMSTRPACWCHSVWHDDTSMEVHSPYKTCSDYSICHKKNKALLQYSSGWRYLTIYHDFHIIPEYIPDLRNVLLYCRKIFLQLAKSLVDWKKNEYRILLQINLFYPLPFFSQINVIKSIIFEMNTKLVHF